MNCSKCQKENTEGAAFCQYCGAQLAPVPTQTSAVNTDTSTQIFVGSSKKMLIAGIIQMFMGYMWLSMYAEGNSTLPIKFMGNLGGYVIIGFGLLFTIMSRITFKNIKLFQNTILVLAIINTLIMLYGWPIAIVGYIIYAKLEKQLSLERASVSAQSLNAINETAAATVQQNMQQEQSIPTVPVNPSNTNSQFMLAAFARATFLVGYSFLIFHGMYIGNLLFLINAKGNTNMYLGQFAERFFLSPNFVIIALCFSAYYFLSYKLKKSITVANLRPNIDPQDRLQINKQMLIWGIASLIMGLIFVGGFFSLIEESVNFYKSYGWFSLLGPVFYLMESVYIVSGISMLYLGIKLLTLRSKDNLVLIKNSSSIFNFGLIALTGLIFPGVGALTTSSLITKMKNK
ncbi:zinc ribbon domain-containing protein [bacterium]|nr:zinc ribbon domain-containing protein [bacterium]